MTEVLDWHIAYGDLEDAMMRTEERTGRPVHAFEERPELSPTLTFVWNAFVELSGLRPQTGFGVSPIGLEAMTRYLDLMGIDDAEARNRAVGLLIRLDRHFCKRVSEKK